MCIASQELNLTKTSSVDEESWGQTNGEGPEGAKPVQSDFFMHLSYSSLEEMVKPTCGNHA